MFQGEQCSSSMEICLWFVSSVWQLSEPLAICSHVQLVNSVLHHVEFTLEQCVCVCVCVRARAHMLMLALNKLRSAGILIDKKEKYMRLVFTEKLNYRSQTWTRKSLNLSQETRMSNLVQEGKQLLKLRPTKTSRIHVLPLHDPGKEDHFGSWFLHSCGRWDGSAVDFLFRWNVISLAGLQKYAK
jgi:hypothetical protein